MDPGIVRCSGCSLIATYPQPDNAELAARYGSDYYAGWDGGGFRRRMWSSRMRIVRNFVGSGRLLDAGCGSGEFLKTARRAGFEVAGIEFSPAARALIKDIAVYSAPEEAPGFWDAITLWHVLEHTRSPRQMLVSLKKKLRPGGVLFVAVPNVESTWFDWIYRCVKRRPPPLYAPECKEPHLFHFSSITLRCYLESCGFDILRFDMDVPYPDFKKRLADAPARFWFRVSGINRTLTLLVVAQ